MARDWQKEYWIECVSLGAEECGAKLTPEQIEFIAESVQGGHECYGMASGDDVASANRSADIERERSDLKKELQRERAKVICRDCNGVGALTTRFGTMQSTSRCMRCDGYGRHDP